jgi:hypothetical protein
MPQQHFYWTVATAYVLTLFPVIYGLIRTLTATGSSHKAVDNSSGLADKAANFP